MDAGRWRGDRFWFVADAGYESVARLDFGSEIFDDPGLHRCDLFRRRSQPETFATNVHVSRFARVDGFVVAGFVSFVDLVDVGNCCAKQLVCLEKPGTFVARCGATLVYVNENF